MEEFIQKLEAIYDESIEEILSSEKKKWEDN
jgi:hypothetical protein